MPVKCTQSFINKPLHTGVTTNTLLLRKRSTLLGFKFWTWFGYPKTKFATPAPTVDVFGAQKHCGLPYCPHRLAERFKCYINKCGANSTVLMRGNVEESYTFEIRVKTLREI